MNNFGFYVIPVVLAITVILGILKKVPVFDVFLKGASEGINSTFAIAPSLIGLITAVSMIKASGALDIFANFAEPISNIVGIPAQIIPLAILKPISGSGSIALLDNIFKNFGTDTDIGKIASVIMGSTETTFYTLTVYFGCIGIKKSRHAVVCALLTDLAALACSIILVKFF